MNESKWSATPIIVVTALLLAAGGLLLLGNLRTAVPKAAPQASQEAPEVSRPPSYVDAARSTSRVSSEQRTSGGVAKQAQTSKESTAAKAPAGQVARQQAVKPALRPAKAAQAAAPTNNLGWRMGTEWTIKVREYATHLLEPQWINVEYRMQVVAVDPAKNSFTVAMRHADASLQPESAQGDLLRAGYVAKNGKLKLAWLQPQGTGPRLSEAKAKGLLGSNHLPMSVSDSPFEGGASVSVKAAGLGTVNGNREALSKGESATYAKGAPWWVSYARGKDLKAELTDFKR